MDCSRNRMRFGGWVNLYISVFPVSSAIVGEDSQEACKLETTHIMCAGEGYKTKSLTVWFMKIGIGIALILLLASRRTFMTR